MGRWSHLDTDEERLPSGMKRIGYDADTQVYSYRDSDGSYWEGAPGCQYGKLHRATEQHAPPLPSIHIADDIRGEEKPYVLHDFYDDGDDDDGGDDGIDGYDDEKAVTRPKQARLSGSHAHQQASKRLPKLPADEGDASSDDEIWIEKHRAEVAVSPVGEEHRFKQLQERQQTQTRPRDRAGPLSRLYSFFAPGSNDTAESHTKKQLSRATTVREASSQEKPPTRRKRATTFDEILDGHPVAGQK
ncbi:hypothetical protein B0H63DRAFT_488626 [Podospora didyma]|uniref:Uncharacterized protein n=1 Tax=Podospora didyma TaxID=330526 RepID=A0AAE0K319_9PEZI|nr:hypothetical protein B0H63DRAFT_488626 [Podospora didyma]